MALFIVDAFVILLVVYGFLEGSRRWWNVLQVFVWAGITAQFGWSLPRQVDEWREQEAVAVNASRPPDGVNDERRA